MQKAKSMRKVTKYLQINAVMVIRNIRCYVIRRAGKHISRCWIFVYRTMTQMSPTKNNRSERVRNNIGAVYRGVRAVPETPL